MFALLSLHQPDSSPAPHRIKMAGWLHDRNPSFFFLLILLVSGCSPAPQQTALPQAIPVVSPTPVPTQDSTSTPNLSSTPDYDSIFLETLGGENESCLPDKTGQCIGVYVYDLDNDQELVSINADIPFQFASAFKGPLLVYFLANCKKYWDTTSPEWNAFFLEKDPANNIDWYMSDEYRQALVEYLADGTNWGVIGRFSAAHQVSVNGEDGPLDGRYFILEQVYKMAAQSNNAAAGSVLEFVYENCPADQTPAIDPKCGDSNAITEFNWWFNRFSNVEYGNGEPQRGLYSWDIIVDTDNDGNAYETRMATYGQKDNCAKQYALLACSGDLPALNAWTARDLFKFYYSLFHSNDLGVKNAAANIFRVDNAGPSRGYMKNMARKMGAEAASKNGYSGFILADAGIMDVHGHFYVIVTLSYDAVNSMEALYGRYNASGGPVGEAKGLLQDLLEGNLALK